MASHEAAAETLQGLFGNLRAEWLEERLFSLFSEPTYFPTLVDRRPTVLVGGRGTGKTTVLRCMTYQGQYALLGDDLPALLRQPYVGIYRRVNTNRVTAFQGQGRSDDEWTRIFSHYVNLEICENLLDALVWFQEKDRSIPDLDPGFCTKLARILN